MKVFRCDKCGKIVEKSQNVITVSIHYVDEEFSVERTQYLDFCDDCGKEVLTFLKMKRGGSKI